MKYFRIIKTLYLTVAILASFFVVPETCFGIQDTATLTVIVVNDDNRPPVFAPIGSQSINEGELLEFTVSASDPDLDTLTYNAMNLPNGAQFNTESRKFSWTPGANASGSYQVTFEVSDGRGGADSETITITVNSSPTGNITVHRLFQDHMVLQKGQTVPIWGTGPDGEAVTVTFNGQSVNTTVSDGKWKVMLSPMDYGGPFDLFIQGTNTITLRDIYVGEVWICSGQSNMEYALPVDEAPSEELPLIRTIKIPRTDGHVPTPLSDIGENAVWRVCTPSTSAGYFNAVGYYFARTLSESMNVAVGIINSTLGGTSIEAWTSLAMQQAVPELQPVLSFWNGRDPNQVCYPANLYNGMIHPIAPFAIKGVCWYQGETVVTNGASYYDQLPALVQDWRNLWKAGDFPFNIVQLPNVGSLQTAPDASTGGWKATREAQLLTMQNMENVGLAVTIDVGDTDIHPPNKEDVGSRLGLWALSNTYGQNIPYSGPIYKSMTIEGNSIRLQFDNAKEMIAKEGDNLTGFTISGQDQNFVWGNATIDGNTILVNSPLVNSPTIVRYAWHSFTPIFNLFNMSGLPASPFRTDCPTDFISDLPTADTTPPSVPVDLTGIAVSSSEINLSWTPSTDNTDVLGYRVYRDGTEIATTATASYSDTGLTPGTQFSYTVSAYDNAGNESLQCASVNVTTQSAMVILVRSSQELSEAIASAQGGEKIIVAPGTYNLTAEIRAVPLIIEAQSEQNKPVVSISSGATIFTVNSGPVTGVEIRNLVFEGNSQAVTAIRSKASGVVIENCHFNNFEGTYTTNPIIYFSYNDQGNEDQMQLSRVSKCIFNLSSQAKGVYSFGPTIVEDCIFENIRLAIHLVDHSSLWSAYPRMDYKNIVRRNEIYRTEGTAWDCEAIITMCTAPEIYENKIYDISISDCRAIIVGSNQVTGSPTLAEIYRNIIISKWKAADSVHIHEGIEHGELPPDFGLIFENILIGYHRPGLYNKGNNNQYFNNTTYFTDSDAYTFHCYGVDCEYKNNLQVGGRMKVRTAEEVAAGVAKGWYPEGSDSDYPSMQYTCFWQMNEGESSYAEGPGFMRADPKFVDPENLNFRLRWDSPCINAGDGSRDGLTVTDIGAYEYPIQVSHFAVNAEGQASWEWHNGFQAVSKKVVVRWNSDTYPQIYNNPADITVAEVSSSMTSAVTEKTTGYFAAFVQDNNDNWSAPTPDNVHRFHLQGIEENEAPIITPIAEITKHEGELVQFDIDVTDPNSIDLITLNAIGLPHGSIIKNLENRKWQFEWQTDFSTNSNSPYTVTVTANDGKENSAPEAITISINNVSTGVNLIDKSDWFKEK